MTIDEVRESEQFTLLFYGCEVSYSIRVDEDVVRNNESAPLNNFKELSVDTLYLLILELFPIQVFKSFKHHLFLYGVFLIVGYSLPETCSHQGKGRASPVVRERPILVSLSLWFDSH